MSSNSIEVKNLKIGYIQGKKHEVILKNISFHLTKGNLVSIIGANGTGKSTLLRTLAHQQPKLSGTVEIENTLLENFSINQWAKQVSWVHTETIIPSSLSVYELVSLGRQPYTNWLDKLKTTDSIEIEKALQLTDLADLKQKKCNTLSDGQLQRVFIARAIAQNTPIIFLDEPTTHLDLHHKVETLTLLKRLCKEYNKTIVFSSHEIELSLQVCDQVLSISQKKVALHTPKGLIETNLLNELFQDSKVHFDKTLGKFLFKE
ncbi:ABC transporter ATP-binding protein [Aquimarina agarivorans]|uniref:ABC transporter ATP-binding protein n=1 Tax=Aquimarina agarivorans TaxID=980584 RepID=UPI000248F8B5|nr:ABC transporter ATP-binding protein [Aquimarina agarivorans]